MLRFAQRAASRLNPRLSGRSAHPAPCAVMPSHAQAPVGHLCPRAWRSELLSHIKPEQDNIAVLHYVLFSFQTYDSFLSGGAKGAALQQVFVVDYLCTDESALEISVDLASCLRSLDSILDGPGPGLFLSGCQEAHQSEQTVARADQFVEAGLCESQVFQEHLLLVIIQF